MGQNCVIQRQVISLLAVLINCRSYVALVNTAYVQARNNTNRIKQNQSKVLTNKPVGNKNNKQQESDS
jgi:hypothetical protein